MAIPKIPSLSGFPSLSQNRSPCSRISSLCAIPLASTCLNGLPAVNTVICIAASIFAMMAKAYIAGALCIIAAVASLLLLYKKDKDAQEIKALQQTAQSLNHTSHKLFQAEQQVKTDALRFQNDLAHLQNENAALRQTAHTFEQQAKASAQIVQQLQGTVTHLQSDVATFGQKEAALQQTIATLHQDLATSKQTFTQVIAQQEQFARSAGVFGNDVAKLNLVPEKIAQQAQEFNTQFQNKITSQNQTQKAELDALRAQIAQMQAQQSSYGTTMTLIRAQLATHRTAALEAHKKEQAWQVREQELLNKLTTLQQAQDKIAQAEANAQQAIGQNLANANQTTQLLATLTQHLAQENKTAKQKLAQVEELIRFHEEKAKKNAPLPPGQIAPPPP